MSTYTLQDTINWAKTFVQYTPLTAGVGNEFAVSLANIIASTLTSAPFTWPWNRSEYTNLVLAEGVQDYVVPLANFGFLEKVTLVTADGKYAYEIKDVYNTLPLGVSISDFAEPKAVSVSFAPGYGNGFGYDYATSVDTATIVSSSIVNISAALLGVGSVSGSISQYISCAPVTADNVVAADFGDIPNTFEVQYTATNSFPPGIPVQVSGTTRQGGDLNISGFVNDYGVTPSATVQIHNVSGISLLSNGPDTGMICPLITTDQPFSNPSASAQDCFSGSNPISLGFYNSYAVPVGSLMTFVAYMVYSNAYITVSSISDSVSNTWYALAPAVELVNGEGQYVTYQVFYTVVSTLIRANYSYGFNAVVSGAEGGSFVGSEVTLVSWNNVGAPIGLPTVTTTSGQQSSISPSLTTTQTAAILAFPMGANLTSLPSSFYTTSSNFAAIQCFWADPSTLSMVAPPGTYSPTFDLSTPNYSPAAVMSAFAIT